MTRSYSPRRPPHITATLATQLGLRIISPLPGLRFLVRCPVDHEFSVRSCVIRQAAARGHRVRCRECEEAKVEARGVCRLCAGLAHRRWLRGCPVCGGAFAALPALVVTEFITQQPIREIA